MFLNQQNNAYALSTANVKYASFDYLFLSSTVPLVIEIDASIFSGEGKYRLMYCGSIFVDNSTTNLWSQAGGAGLDLSRYFSCVLPVGYKLDSVAWSNNDNFLYFNIRKTILAN